MSIPYKRTRPLHGILCGGLFLRQGSEKVTLPGTRVKIDKLHKGVMNRNVQNKKIKYLASKQIHAAGRFENETKIKFISAKN